MLLSGRAPTDAPNRERCVSERESSHSFMCLVSLFATFHVGVDGGGRRRARGEDEVWGVRGHYTCNTTSFDTLYSITVVEAARIEGS